MRMEFARESAFGSGSARGSCCRAPARSTRTRARPSCRWPKLDHQAGRAPAGKRGWTAMSLVLALLGALRAALGTRTDLVLENWRSDSRSPCSATARSDFGSVPSIACSGCGSRSGGHGGARRSMSSSLGPSFGGTGKASARSGTGNRDAVEPVVRRSLPISPSSSVPWPSPIPSGARRESMASS